MADHFSWKLTYYGFDPSEEGLREALCTLANGYMGVRGAAYESAASKIHYPAVYIAGVYNKLATHIAGKIVYNEDLVNCPNWTFIRFKAGEGEYICPSSTRLLMYRQELNMLEGVLSRRVRVQDKHGRRTLIETQRIVSMASPHLAALRYVITPENYNGWITVQSLLDGAVINSGVERYRQLNSKHLVPVSLGNFSKNGIYLIVRTNQSKIEVAQSARLRVFVEGEEKKPSIHTITRGRERIEQSFKMFVVKGRSYAVEKTVAVYTSRDKGIKSPANSSIGDLKKPQRFINIYKEHISAWEDLWRKADIKIDGDIFAQKAVRLHIFHILQTASPHISQIDAGFPARGLHGEAYRGHIFWDEVYAMPFFDYHFPEISKALLLYRYRRLVKARQYARKNGYKGAMFPWQSASTGEEETQILHLNPLSGEWGPDYSRYQRHVSFAIAYNVWQYYFHTEDKDFLCQYGAEMLLSIARFAASLTIYDPKTSRYHTEKVMGPDEFHEKYPDSETPGLKDNTYTNLLIVWVLLKAMQALNIIPDSCKNKLLRKLNISPQDLSLWQDITYKMNILIDEKGIIAQFQGYFDLKELDWNKYRQRYEKIERMDRILKAEGKSPDEYKVSKQADALMIFYLLPLNEVRDIFRRLGYYLDKDILKRNYEYYVKRTSHGSSLSKVVHCYLAQILKRPKETIKWLLEVLQSDMFDTQGGTTPEGIHSGVMAGSLDIISRGVAGIQVLEDRIKIEPFLPRKWQGVSLKFCYKGRWFFVSVRHKHISLFIQGRRYELYNIPIWINNRLHYLLQGKRYNFTY